MLNYIWAFMIIVGILYASITGNMKAVTDAALNCATEAVSLCITMAGVMGFWMGLMKIAEKAGVIGRFSKAIQPFLTFLFPRIPREHKSRQYIAANFIANILGLGWACTPAGLMAMESLAELEEERGNPEYLKTGKRGNPEYLKTGKNGKASEYWKEGKKGNASAGARRASNEMCTFLIMNTSSLQLIPVNMIVYRTQYGSANPSAVIAPAILATLLSSLTALIYCKFMDKKDKQ